MSKPMTTIPAGVHITYQLQYRKCGKPNCTTCKTGSRHGPYWYAYWHEGEKMRVAYVGKAPPADLPDAVVARQQARAAQQYQASCGETSSVDSTGAEMDDGLLSLLSAGELPEPVGADV